MWPQAQYLGGSTETNAPGQAQDQPRQQRQQGGGTDGGGRKEAGGGGVAWPGTRQHLARQTYISLLWLWLWLWRWLAF